MSTLIVDGSYFLHRVLHVPSLADLSTSDGKPVGGLFGVLKSLRSTLYKWDEIDRVVYVFDAGHSKRRLSLYSGYKVRKEKDNELDKQKDKTYLKKYVLSHSYLKFILPRLGIKFVEIPGKEGDDVVGLLTKKLKSLKIIASDDRDMFQLLDKDVQLWRPIAEELITVDDFELFTGCKQKYWLLRKAILGDGSDKIPGVKGVAEKTFAKILDGCDPGEYPFEPFFEYCLELGSKKSLSLVENIETVLRNYKLVDISLEEFDDDQVSYAMNIVDTPTEFDILAVKRVFTSFEFFSMISNFERWVTRFQVLR